ncbi:MAG: hypothetical protein ABIW48_02725 [Burkholderiales bacterium]
MKRFHFIVWLLLWVSGGYAAEVEIVSHNPRPFGYVVGDTVSRDLVISVKSGYALDEKTLPKPGRLSAWLELRSVDVREIRVAAGRRFGVKMTYQLPNSPTEVRMVELPAHRFSFVGPGKPLEATSGEWPITLAPLTPEEVLARDGLEAMRPDTPPTGVDTKAVRRRLIGYGLVLAAIVLYGAYRYFGIPYLAKMRRPFARAYRDLTRLNQRDFVFSQVIDRIHKALNETAGRSLFIANVDHFLSCREIDRSLTILTREFFEISRDEFFAGGNLKSRRSFTWLLDFCRAWRDVERGSA